MKTIHIICVLLLATTFFGCQKVIHVDLNSTAPRYVIEGNVTDQPGPYTVKITRTVNFDQDNTFPGVSGARVVITDVTASRSDTLAEVSPGMYQTHTLAGVAGHTYSMAVVAAGSSFSATSAMPQPVHIDSVYFQASVFGNDTDIVPLYKDPAGTGNYYHLLLTINDSLSQEIYTHDDEIQDGNEVNSLLRNHVPVNSGNTVAVELQCVDYGVYEYYRNLEQTIRQNSATPANPQSSLTGGALGYFSAHTVSRRGIVVP